MPSSTPTIRRLVTGIVMSLLWVTGGAQAVSAGDNPYTTFLPIVMNPCLPPALPTPGGWLEYLNFYRGTACLPPLYEDSILSYGDTLHAKYIVKNDELQHSEDPANQWYSPEGHAAAQRSNLAASYNASQSDVWAIDAWMQAPFHAVGMLDPQLKMVGYGSYREADGNLQMGAGIDIYGGKEFYGHAFYPKFWPAQGTTVPINLHWGEYPDPLTSCPGYSAPSGLPIIVQMGPGSITPSVTGSYITMNGIPLDHCVFDETSYYNPDVDGQNTGRIILDARDAIVLIPRDPLQRGQTFDVSITVDGKTYQWSFSVSKNALTSKSVDTPGIVR